MCGICGELNPAGARPEDLSRMLQAIVHRGPDDEGRYVSGPVSLGTRRLSIIDLVGGHQPIFNEDGAICVVHNGEIYNFQELRTELENRGHTFRTQTDTEVIVHLYEELGERCVARLRGMFAFAIWDGRSRKLVVARDRLGQKPLFYEEDGDRFLFASEIKAILAARLSRSDIDYESLHHYLSLRFVPSPRTMFRGIRKLPPAHVLVLESGSLRTWCYWSLSFGEKLHSSEAEIQSHLDEKLAETVRRHLISDVPVGALLSGGMDSSIVVAFAARQVGPSLATFSIGVKEQDFNELPFARLVAERYKTDHTEKIVDIDLIGALPTIISHLDEPSDPIAACQYSSAGLAAQHVKVVLGGDGGDELFAGFDRYRGIALLEHYFRIPSVIRTRALTPFLLFVPDTFGYKNLAQRLRWVQHLSMAKGMGQRYAEATCFSRFSHAQKKELFAPDLWKSICGTCSTDIIVDQFNRADSSDPIDRMLYADYTTRLPEHSLMLTDRMTMAWGLELRSPLLDHELVEFMATVSSRLKIRRGELKYILRKLARQHLPTAITRRPKQGFMFPIAYWFRKELAPFLAAFWRHARIVREGLVRSDVIARLVDEHREGLVDHHVRLWMLLNLELWYRIYMDGAEPSDLGDELKAHVTGQAAGRRDLGPVHSAVAR